jgi:membrane protein YdbS with pleckstrin-like domain
VPFPNQTATPDAPSESFPSPDSFVTKNFIVDPGAAPNLPVDNPVSAPGANGPTAGLEDEATIWEGRVSLKNFLGRAVFGGVLDVAWIALAIATWGFGYSGLAWVTYAGGAAVIAYWVMLGLKIARTRRNYFYRLTTRRLFLTTGIFQRRVDQVELVRIKDLFVRQSLISSWLDIGTLILISSEPTLPKVHLLGVETPQNVRDMIWLHSRLERDQRTSEVNHV